MRTQRLWSCVPNCAAAAPPAVSGAARAASLMGALALVLAGAGCLSALSGGGDGATGAPGDAGWLSGRVGVGFLDTLQVDLGEPTQGATSPVAIGVGLHYRTARFDVGGLFEGTAGQRHASASGEHPIGASFRAAGTLRWRYLDGPWGALYLRLAPAFMVLGHSEHVGAFIEGETGAVDDHSLAFSLGADVGVLFYLDDRVALSLGVDLVTAATTVGTATRDVGYNTVRGLFTVGLEWRM